MWEEIALARVVSLDEVRGALAAALDIEPASIHVVPGLVQESAPPGARMLVEVKDYPGEYPLLLSSYPLDLPAGAMAQDDLAIVRKVSAALGVAALVDDGTLCDLTWLRVWPSGEVELVLVDDDALERNELKIVRVLRQIG